MPAPDGVRTIPVPRDWSVEQAWEHIRRGHLLIDPDPWWAEILIRDGSLAKVFDERLEMERGGS